MSYAKSAMQACKALSVPIYETPKTVQQAIPIYKIAEDGIFLLEKKKEGEDKRFDKAYRFDDANYSLKNEEEQEEFLKLYCQFLNSMNVSFKLCIMNNNRDMEEMVKNVYVHTADPDFEELADDINANIENKIREGRNGIDQVKIFVITCERQNIDYARDFFRTIEANLKANFNRMGSRLTPLNATERLRYLHCFYRLGKEEEFDFDFHEAVKTRRDWRNAICNTFIREHADAAGRFDGKTMEMDGRFIRVLFIRKFPNSVNDEFIKMLTSVSYHTVITLDIAPIPQEVATKRLFDLYMSTERSIEKQQEQRNRARAYSSDISYEKRKEKEEIESYLDLMNDNDERLFYLGGYVVVSADSMEELEANVLSLTTTAANYSVGLEPAWFRQKEALDTALPIGCRFCDTMRPVFTQPLCAFTPFNVQELYHPGGIYLGINQVSKNIIMGDRLKLMNPHGFVLGQTGGGKGYDVKSEMIQIRLKRGDMEDLIVIDPQNEYVSIANALKGTFIDVSASSANSINPLDAETLENFHSEEAFVGDKTELMLGISEQILKHEITMGQKSIAGRCVQLVYKDYFENRKKQSPTMEDFYRILKEQPEIEAKDLKLAFELFVEGSLNYFAKQTNVDTSRHFIVYGIQNLGGDLSSVGQLVILESIRARIARNYKRGITTRLYIDEFHNLAQGYSLKFLQKLWKEARKYGGVITGITQNIVDLLETAEVQKMLGNSQYLSLLNMGENEINILGSVLGLNDETLEYLRGAEQGCGILRFGDNTYIPRANQIPKGSKIYELFNTNFQETKATKIRKRELKKEFDLLPKERQAEALKEEISRQKLDVKKMPETGE